MILALKRAHAHVSSGLYRGWAGLPRGNYRSRNCGSRFSRKAAMPSFWSSVAKSAWKLRRSNRIPSRKVVS
ncbi:hypothetical protein D3C76_1865630 [compost metagenome]